MFNHPDETFDHAVLDLIDHSPTGAVPVTPSYQDALRRLYATHQVYAAADHKDGHVTARSLAKAPRFHACNLDELSAGVIRPDELESNAGIFARYVQSLPPERRAAAEARRLQVAGRPVHHRAGHGPAGGHDPVHSLFLVPGAGPSPGLPGNYLYGMIYETGLSPASWAIRLHDGGDAVEHFDAADLPEAIAKLREVLESCPFDLRELDALGFRPL